MMLPCTGHKHESRKSHFNQVHVDPATGNTIATGARVMAFGVGQKEPGELLDSQASYAVPLALNVFDETDRTACCT